jgi:YD repeat-containing protein
MKKLIVMFFLFSISSFLYAKDKDMSDSQYPDYTMCKIRDRKTIAHLDGIWHDVKVEYDDNGLIVYRGVHEKKSPSVQNEDWCVWKYTYDSHGRQTRVQGPLHGKFGWEDKTSNAYWYANTGSYNSGVYTSDVETLSIVYQDNTVASGTNVRITFNGIPDADVLFDYNDGTNFETITGVISGQKIVLSYDFLKYGEIRLTSDGTVFKITKIEFGFNPFDTP